MIAQRAFIFETVEMHCSPDVFDCLPHDGRAPAAAGRVLPWAEVWRRRGEEACARRVVRQDAAAALRRKGHDLLNGLDVL